MSTQLPRLGECRDCHDPIRFVKLDTGRLMPVNPKPGATGSVCARLVIAPLGSVEGKELRGYVIAKDRPADPTWPYRFVPHPATCPERKPSKPTTPTPAPDPALF